MRPPIWRILAILLALGLVAASCGDDDDGEETESGDETAAADETERPCDEPLGEPPAEPVTIRQGHGFAAEEPWWLMTADPEIAEHQGEWYELENTPFRANEERFVAFQAGELDAVTAPAPTIAQALAEGIPLQAVVSMVREAEAGDFRTTFTALDDSGIEDASDLEGKTIGIVDLNSATHYWAQTAVAEAGLDHQTDVEYVVLPFPAQEEALRGGQIDAAVMVEPFYSLAQSEGGIVDVFDSVTGPGFDQELLFVAFGDDFLDENPKVVCAWIEDFQAAMASYRENPEDAKRVIHESGFVQTPLEIYLQASDWFRPERGAIDLDNYDRLIESLVEFDISPAAADTSAEDVVATEFAPLEGEDTAGEATETGEE